MRNTLHGSRPGTDNCDPFVAQVFHRRARWITACIIVVPAAGMECMSLKSLDTRNAGKLGYMQRSWRHANILCGKFIASVGFN